MIYPRSLVAFASDLRDAARGVPWPPARTRLVRAIRRRRRVERVRRNRGT